MRFLVSVFICVYSGSVIIVVLPSLLRGRLNSAAAAGFGALVCLGVAFAQVRQQWKADGVTKRAVFTAALLYAGLILGAVAARFAGAAPTGPLEILIAALAFQGAVLVLANFLVREHATSWNEAFGFSINPRWAIAIGLAFGCMFLPLGWLLQHLSMLFFQKVHIFGIRPEQQQVVQVLKGNMEWLSRLVLAITTVLLAPIGEELLFRGVLFQWIRQIGFTRSAAYITAFIFAIVHMNGPTFLPLFVLALILAFVYERTSNLLAPIATHAAFNLMNFLLLQYLQSKA